MPIKRAFTTQSLANSYPPWSNIRQDQQSLGQQFLNVVGNRLDDLRKQIDRIGRNYVLTTSNISDIDVVYQYKLPDNFLFTTDEDQDGVVIPLAPTISGIVGSNTYGVSVTDENTIESFWYDSLPTRADIGDTVSGIHLVMSGVVDATPFAASGINFLNSGLLTFENNLWVEISDSTKSMDILDSVPVRGTIRIDGVNRTGREDTEYLVFLYNKIQPTIKEWSEVSNVEVYNIEPSGEAQIHIYDFPAGLEPKADFYQHEKSKDSKESIEIFWSVENYIPDNEETTVPVLNKVAHQSDQFQNLIAGLSETEVVHRVELLDTSSARIDDVIDLAIQPFTDRIWILTDTSRLYVYDRYIISPNMSLATKKQFDALTVIELSSDYGILQDDLEIDFSMRRPIKSLQRHRVYIQKPNGVIYLLDEDDVLSAFTAGEGFVTRPANNRFIRGTNTVVLDQRGEWIITLETRYSDETTEYDQRVVRVDSREALAEFDLSSAISNPTGLDFDSDHRLWVVDADNVNYPVELHYDIALVDFERKAIFFRENYDRVRVSP